MTCHILYIIAIRWSLFIAEFIPLVVNRLSDITGVLLWLKSQTTHLFFFPKLVQVGNKETNKAQYNWAYLREILRWLADFHVLTSLWYTMGDQMEIISCNNESPWHVDEINYHWQIFIMFYGNRTIACYSRYCASARVFCCTWWIDIVGDIMIIYKLLWNTSSLQMLVMDLCYEKIRNCKKATSLVKVVANVSRNRIRMW